MEAVIESRILFVTDHIHFPQGGGGLERNTHDLCLDLKARGHAVAVAASLSPDGSALALRSRLRKFAPPLPSYPRDGACGYPTYRGWRLNDLPDVLDAFRPDVVVAQSTAPDVIFAALRTRSVPQVLYVHEVDADRFLLPAAAPIADWADWLSRLWDDPVLYGRMSVAAQACAGRSEIQTASIVSSFLQAVGG